MWRLRWRVCLWTCLVLLGAVAVGWTVQALTVGGGGLTGVGASISADSPSVQFEHHSPDSNDTLAMQTERLVWFMQVSDIHLSMFRNGSRTSEFRQFCQSTVPAVKPAVILVSGDLTDAKEADGMGSRQYLEEWQQYRSILQDTGLYNTTVWLDVRGNHDNFNLRSLSSAANHFASHSVQGRQHARSYLHSVRGDHLDLAFVAVDASLLPGPKRPFNFVGVLPPSEFSLLQQLSKEATATHDHTFFFGHYPTSCIVGPEHGVDGVRELMAGGEAYLCGHLHSLGGLVPAMHTRQRNGLLELELEDWKDGRMFRVMAMDHGQFSFVDVRHDTWPVILVSSPVHALYAKAGLQEQQRLSSHVRVLVWARASIVRVAVRVGGAAVPWQEMQHVEGPLYVVKWNTSLYQHGLHHMEVLAEASDGSRRVIGQPFSFDGTHPSFRFLPRVFLMLNVSAAFQFLFGCSICMCILVLCIFKYLHHSTCKTGRRNICRGGMFRWTFLRAVTRKIWLLSSVDQIFWPLIFYMLYLPVGPWMVGELLDDQYGVVFSWGTFVYSSFLPGSLTFAYGFILMLTFILPLILCLAHCIDCRMKALFQGPCVGLAHHTCKNLPLVVLISYQAFLSYLMFLAYGWLCVLFGPIRSWSVLLGLVLWLQVERLPATRLQSQAALWYGDSSTALAARQQEYDDINERESVVHTWLRKDDHDDDDGISDCEHRCSDDTKHGDNEACFSDATSQSGSSDKCKPRLVSKSVAVANESFSEIEEYSQPTRL